jgi:CheY-like chemotaxis protein
MSKVLLVDDDMSVRVALRQILSDLGHEVTEASDGAEAIAQISNGSIDLVLTDLLMPGTDGFEAIRHLRKKAPQIRLIAMSGGGLVGPSVFLDLAEQLGAVTTLLKPFSKSDLETAINYALRA